MVTFRIFMSALLLCGQECKGITYEENLAVQRSLLHKSVYDPELRPLLNQSDIMHVEVTFTPIAVVDVDDISQSFQCNGFIHLQWTDELIASGNGPYGSLNTNMYPRVQDVWKPRLILINTMNERDPFKDEFAPLWINTSGHADWFPGSLFHTSCILDMSKFPFDEQECMLYLFPMNHGYDEMRIYASSPNMDSAFQDSSEWEVVKGETVITKEMDSLRSWSAIRFIFQLRRRPYTFIYTFIQPAILLSVISLLVFIIPADSGEKLTYGITMLLAEAVFMTSITSSLPATTGSAPATTVYVMILLHLEAFTVIVSIVVVALNRLDQTDAREVGSSHVTASVWTKETFSESGKGQKEPPNLANLNHSRPLAEQLKTRDWKLISKWINIFGFVLSTLFWVASTLWYFITVLS